MIRFGSSVMTCKYRNKEEREKGSVSIYRRKEYEGEEASRELQTTPRKRCQIVWMTRQHAKMGPTNNNSSDHRLEGWWCVFISSSVFNNRIAQRHILYNDMFLDRFSSIAWEAPKSLVGPTQKPNNTRLYSLEGFWKETFSFYALRIQHRSSRAYVTAFA